MATHSSTLAWKIPWTEELGRLQSMGSLRVRHDWATSLSLFTFMCWRRKWQPTPVLLPGESQGWGNLVGAIYGVEQSRTRLKRLSSNSSWERLRAGREGDDRGWDSQMASLTQWTWVWTNSRNSQGQGMLQFMGSQRIKQDLITEQQQL